VKRGWFAVGVMLTVMAWLGPSRERVGAAAIGSSLAMDFLLWLLTIGYSMCFKKWWLTIAATRL
jgi:hypothetical protein